MDVDTAVSISKEELLAAMAEIGAGPSTPEPKLDLLEQDAETHKAEIKKLVVAVDTYGGAGGGSAGGVFVDVPKFSDTVTEPILDTPPPYVDEATVPEEEQKSKTFKAEKLANGFMVQANPLAEGKEPFYMEAYLLGNNEFYVAGGMSGTLNTAELKQIRKQMKALINQMDESYPDPDTEKGGKAVIKVEAPWIPTEVQKEAVSEIVGKTLAKIAADADVDMDPSVEEAATKAAVTAISQVLYEKFTEGNAGE